jgi:hypothetical protein
MASSHRYSCTGDVEGERVHLSVLDQFTGAMEGVEMRTVCQFQDTCPELHEVLLIPLTDSYRAAKLSRG